MQQTIAKSDSFVLNRKAFRTSAESTLEFLNNGGRFSTPLNEDGSRFTSAHIDDVERIVMSCSRKDSENSDISKILIEEMPAYFLGQKNLDDVIKITQDRVLKVLNERE